MQVMLADLIAYFAILLPYYARMLTSGKPLIWWSNMEENKISIRIVCKKYSVQISI